MKHSLFCWEPPFFNIRILNCNCMKIFFELINPPVGSGSSEFNYEIMIV